MTTEMQKLEWELIEAARDTKQALDYRDSDWVSALFKKAADFVRETREACGE